MSVAFDWKISWINQGLIYCYCYFRFLIHFDDVPSSMPMSLATAVLYYSFGCYMLSLTLKREFLAIYTQKKSAGSFYKTWSAIPDGVAIIENQNSKCNFINPNLKNIFDLKNYCEEEDWYEAFKDIQEKIDKEFSEAIHNLRPNLTEFNIETDINNLTDKWIVSRCPNCGGIAKSSNFCFSRITNLKIFYIIWIYRW